MAVLGYWDIRGLAEPIRYILHYTDTEFEDKRYGLGPPPDYDRKEWLKDKFKLGLDFPNLPYFVDGDDVKLTHCTAIMRHLAREHHLDGKNETERMRADLAEQQLTDMRMNMIRVCYSPDFEKLKGDVIRNIPDQLKMFCNFMGSNKWTVSDNITYVDFIAYDCFDFYRLMVPGCLNKFPSLLKFMKRFEELPAIEEYMDSDSFKRWPIFGPMAKFGGGGEMPTE